MQSKFTAGQAKPTAVVNGVGVAYLKGAFVRTDWPNPSSYYDGAWANDVPHGYGRLFAPNSSYGDSSVGCFKDGRREGHCHDISERLFYDGLFIDNLRHGWGIMAFRNGSTYVVLGKRCGWGHATSHVDATLGELWPVARTAQDVKLLWGNQSDSVHVGLPSMSGAKPINPLVEYWGEWQDHKRHGVGKMKWANGSTFVGQWFEGNFTTKGVKWQGTWRRNKLTHDPCVVTLPDGTRYQGVCVGLVCVE
jgi:hypothetical protein